VVVVEIKTGTKYKIRAQKSSKMMLPHCQLTRCMQ